MATADWYETTTTDIMETINRLPDWMQRRVKAVWNRYGAEVLAELCRMLLEAPVGPRTLICFIAYPPETDNILTEQVRLLGGLCQELVKNLHLDIAEAKTIRVVEFRDWKGVKFG